MAALIDAGCMIMRLLRIVGLPLGRMTTVPSAEAAREKHREFAGAKCDSPYGADWLPHGCRRPAQGRAA